MNADYAVNAPHQKTKTSRVFELNSEFVEARQAPRQIGHRLHAYSLKNVALWQAVNMKQTLITVITHRDQTLVTRIIILGTLSL